MKQDCQKTSGCWLPQGHQGECQPCYEQGDHVKVEFPGEVTGIGEWMWMRVDHRDDEKRLVYGTLDNESVFAFTVGPGFRELSGSVLAHPGFAISSFQGGGLEMKGSFSAQNRWMEFDLRVESKEPGRNQSAISAGKRESGLEIS